MFDLIVYPKEIIKRNNFMRYKTWKGIFNIDDGTFGQETGGYPNSSPNMVER